MDEGLSLAGLPPALDSVGRVESRLWSSGDMALGLAGTLGGVELKLPVPLLWFLCCFSFGQSSRWLEVKVLPLSDPDEVEEAEEDEEAVPLPEEPELSPGCGAILG